MRREFRFGPFSGLLLMVCTLLSSDSAVAADERPFGIQIIDEQTGRGVPLVELTTVNRVNFITDSAGWAAIDEPSLNGQRVFFSVKSHGYEFPADGFGYRGKTLRVQPSETATLKIHRKNIAERLCRLTGAGIYQDSVSLGRDTPIEHPLLNAGVLGSDSVVNAIFKNRMHWFWGDTNLPQYPLGLFHVPGATSPLPSAAEVNVDRGLNFRYFTDEIGLARNSCEMPGKGPTWIDGLTVLEDDAGNEKCSPTSSKSGRAWKPTNVDWSNLMTAPIASDKFASCSWTIRYTRLGILSVSKKTAKTTSTSVRHFRMYESPLQSNLSSILLSTKLSPVWSKTGKTNYRVFNAI